MKIETSRDWWQSVNDNWVDLLKIMCKFLPMDKNEDIDKDILDFPLIVHVTELKEKEDAKLLSYFKSAWWCAPDCSNTLKIPGWGVLCDLCSEDWVLDTWLGDTPKSSTDDDEVEFDPI